MVCDIDEGRITAAAEYLNATYGKGSAYATVCDVGSTESVDALAAYAQDKVGDLDIWINNAGRNGGKIPLWEQTPENLAGVVGSVPVAVVSPARGNMGRCHAAGVGLAAADLRPDFARGHARDTLVGKVVPPAVPLAANPCHSAGVPETGTDLDPSLPGGHVSDLAAV